GEAGNAWAHSTPQNDVVLNTLGAMAKISVVTDGRCATTFKIELDFEVPAEASPDGKSRSNWMRTLKISQYLSLKRGTPRLEIRTEVENTAKDHWLRVIFPTGIKTNHDFADSHFDIVQRKIKLPDTDTWKEPAVGTKPMRSFVDINDGKVGLAILTRGLLEYEVFDYAERPVAITLLRTFSINMEVSEAKKQALPDTGSQCLGKQVFEYAIYPHQGDTFSGKVQEQATEFCVPLRAVQFGLSPRGTLAWDYGFFKQPPRNLIISAIKKAEADKKIILRLYNPTEKELQETLEFGFNVNSAFLLNLAEQVLEKLKVSNKNTINLTVPPKKIITIGLQTANIKQLR
ncbi:MAG: glycosyl hydrolase-related protein, partial [Candidatus Sumerlaeia bacterium]|nr:glycosyl hydrolase-related protein [Candidatus Sumerlaeia bacterium]